MNSTAVALLLAVLPAQTSRSTATVHDAVIELAHVSFIHDVQVPAQESGVLMSLAVREGSAVPQGELLAQIDDRKPQLAKKAAQLEYDAAMAQAQDTIEVEYSQAAHAVALAELERDQRANQRSPNSVPESDVHYKRLAEHRARLQIQRSQLEQRVAQMNAEVHSAAVAAADENILRCRVTAPFDGTVVELLRQQGEWVNAGEPVLRLARMDRLQVEGRLDASQYDAYELAGRRVTISVQLARGRTARFDGQVVHVHPQVQSGNMYRVRAEVVNRQETGHWILQPGLPASMTIHLN